MVGETIQFERTDEDTDGKRQQSTIAFPYLDLDAGVEVARAIYNRAGLGSCDLDELAAEMGQVISGAFRMKTGTAKIFDLTEKEGKSSIKLSELGRQIISADTERAARVVAFLRVPLYSAVYEKYKGHLLPPPKALEREMQGFGVSSKQTDKARQAFERSAKQAGFFDAGEDRLVRPRLDLPTKEVKEFDEQLGENSGRKDPPGARDGGGGGAGGGAGSGEGGGGAGDGGNEYHPLIKGLLITLPKIGEPWPEADRKAWLTMAESIFAMIYQKVGEVKRPAEMNTATDQ